MMKFITDYFELSLKIKMILKYYSIKKKLMYYKWIQKNFKGSLKILIYYF